MSESKPVMQRYYGIDCFRAILMLLGIVIHASIFYFLIPNQDLQVYLDRSTSPFLEGVFYFFHTYRMPCFFVVAGFFAAFLCDTRGKLAFFMHRWKRIGIPLIAGTIVLFPLMGVVTFSTQLYTEGPQIQETSPYAIFESLFLHLWFLYHLLIFSVVAIGVVHVVSRLPERIRETTLAVFERFTHSPVMLIALSIPTGILLYQMDYWTLDQSSSPLPPLRILAIYAIFFAFGWFLFKRLDLLEGFKRHAWTKLAIALLLFALYYFFLMQRLVSENPVMDHVLAIAFLAPSTWIGIYAFLGLFLRYFDKPSATWRYISDGSYWMYLIHLPIVIGLAPVLSAFDIAAEFKFAFICIATTFLCLVTYHFFVRATFIGVSLNGRRYPRVAPWRQAATE